MFRAQTFCEGLADEHVLGLAQEMKFCLAQGDPYGSGCGVMRATRLQKRMTARSTLLFMKSVPFAAIFCCDGLQASSLLRLLLTLWVIVGNTGQNRF